MQLTEIIARLDILIHLIEHLRSCLHTSFGQANLTVIRLRLWWDDLSCLTIGSDEFGSSFASQCFGGRHLFSLSWWWWCAKERWKCEVIWWNILIIIDERKKHLHTRNFAEEFPAFDLPSAIFCLTITETSEATSTIKAKLQITLMSVRVRSKPVRRRHQLGFLQLTI